MPSAASLARYPAFLKHDQLSTNQFNPDQSNNLSSNSSISSSSSFDLPSLINGSFLQSEFQRNIAQFTNQLTMTGQNELLSNANGTNEHNSLQYSDDQLINNSNKKLSFSIDSLVNGKHSALNKQSVAAALFNGLNGTGNLNSIKKDTNDLSAQNLQNNINAMAAAALALNRNGNHFQTNLHKISNHKDELRGSPNSRLISPCSSTSSVCSDQRQQQQINCQQNAQRTSANNSPRPASAASQHSGSHSASQLLSAQNSLNTNNAADGNQSSSTNSKNSFNKIKIDEHSRSPQTVATTNSRPSTSPSFINNISNISNSSIKESPANLPTDAALLQHIQQQQLRQQIQQQLQQVSPDSALLQHIQQQQLRQLQNTPLPSASPHLQAHPNQSAINQASQSNSTTPQQQPGGTGSQLQTSPFSNNNNPTNTAAALLNQLRANSLNGGVSNPTALNPLNGLNLPNPASLASQPNLPNLPPGLNQLGQLGLNAAATMNSPLNPLASLNPLSPPRPHSLADYSSYYQYLAMTRPNYYPLGKLHASLEIALKK